MRIWVILIVGREMEYFWRREMRNTYIGRSHMTCCLGNTKKMKSVFIFCSKFMGISVDLRGFQRIYEFLNIL